MIPLSVPNFEGNEEKYVMDAVSQGWVSTVGAYVDRLEKEMESYTSAVRAVACQSGTAGIHLALMECGVKSEDMVIVPTLTFIAAVNPVHYIGAEPIFMDSDDSLCMAPEKLRLFCESECDFDGTKLIHKGSKKQVKAIVVVHVFGNLADMEQIMDVAEKYGLKVVEDATEALGTICEYGKYKGKMAGCIGDFGVYSFNGNKIITTGGGGMVVGQDRAALDHIQYVSTQCKDDPLFYIHEEVGYNYRMTNVQAAIGVAQMEELEEFIRRKNNNYEKYKQKMMGWTNGELLAFRDQTRSNKWFYSFCRSKKAADESVRECVLNLQKKGVQTRPIWGLIHEQKPYRSHIAFEVEKACEYSKRIINIPCSTNLTEEEINTVVNCMKDI